MRKNCKACHVDGYSKRSAKDQSGVREREGGRESYGSEGEAKRA